MQAAVSWQWQCHELADHAGTRLTVSATGQLLTQAEFFKQLGEPEFARQFTKQLLACGYEAVFWETPMYQSSAAARVAFECVLIDAPDLATKQPGFTAFSQQFEQTDATVVSFKNLSGNTDLLSPCPQAGLAYGHLLAFLRVAPAEQIVAFWALSSRVVTARAAGRQPFWVSTAGLGVPWLHLRLDQAPKYYRYRPYCCRDHGQ